MSKGNRKRKRKPQQSQRSAPKVKRTHKDSVFRILFRDKERLLELFNALNGTDHGDPDDIEITTLENAIYMSLKNDLSFILGNCLNLYEHQSTLSPNLPFRMLLYVADILQKLYYDKRMVYGRKAIKIKGPHFLVLYNGADKAEEKFEYKLSDLYERSDLGDTNDAELELKVTVLNINDGKNADIMGKCPALKGYAAYVALVRGYMEKCHNTDKAVNMAVDECIKQGILRDFFIKNKTEVIKMSIYEYDEAAEKEVIRKEEREQGLQQGLQQGRQQGRQEGENMLSALINNLLSAGKTEESLRVTTDLAFREELYVKYGLKKA